MKLSIKRLIVPVLWAGMILGVSSQAMGALTFTNVVDSQGRQWGDPFSVALGTYSTQLKEITDAGFTAASIEDVVTMYKDQFGPEGDTDTWALYVDAFSMLGKPDARTVTGRLFNGQSFHRATGNNGQIQTPIYRDLDRVLVPGTTTFYVADITEVVSSGPLGFMFYKLVPEPSLTLLLGGSLMGLGYMAYRRKRA